MNYIAACIEQLDLAATQLSAHSSAYDRFALILTDNIVELMLHHRCDEAFRWDKRKWNHRPQYSPDDRKKILGDKFQPKVDFCEKLGVLTAQEKQFVSVAHSYRNELYHAGIRHDPILHALAWHYHDVACDLFGRILSGTWSGWTSATRVSATVEKYMGDGNAADASIPELLPGIAHKLSHSKPAFTEPIGRVMSGYVLLRCEQFEESLSFLVSDNPNGLSESEMLEHIQFHRYMFSDDSPHLAAIKQCTSCRDLDVLMKKVKQQWAPPFRRNPLPDWRNRATRLAAVTSRNAALQRFKQLDDEMWDFEHLVHEAAVEMAVDLDI